MKEPLDRPWPFVLVDESALATEPTTLVPVCRGAKIVVLVGDQNQLPPIVSKAGCAAGLQISMFERLIFAGMPHTFLDTQYRMHPRLSEFPMLFYNNNVLNGLSTSTHQIPREYPWPNPAVPICMLHVAEDEISEEGSITNPA